MTDGTRGLQSWDRSTSCFSCQTRHRSEWCQLHDDELALLNRSKVEQIYEAGQVLFHEGSPCIGVYCLEEGTLGLRKRGHNGESVITRLCHPGDTLGYVAYFTGRPYSATAEALSRSTVCFIRTATVGALLQRNPSLGYRFMGTLARRITDTEESKVEALLHPLRARVAHLLLILKDRFGTVDDSGVLTIDMPLSRQDIAALVGARPESISRVIRQLEEIGVARFDGRSVRVPDLDPLMDAAELLSET